MVKRIGAHNLSHEKICDCDFYHDQHQRHVVCVAVGGCSCPLVASSVLAVVVAVVVK